MPDHPGVQPASHTSRWNLAALCLLGVAMFASNGWYAAVDDECAIIGRAAQPIAQTVRLFVSGRGQHEHPPLYDLLLHVWLTLTRGNLHLARVPATFFYLAGIWVLARAAKRIAGPKAEFWTLIVGVLCPYGFHFGRVAAWYSFCFLLVALETYLCLRYSARRTWTNWVLLLLCSLALIYTNYFGWAVLALLAFDFWLLNRAEGIRPILSVLGMGAILFGGFLPIVAVFSREIHGGIHAYQSPLSMVLTGVYVLYSMFVSESVAPWYWQLGIPACIAIALILLLVLFRSPLPARRFLGYFLIALAAMTALGIVETKRTMMIVPWLILPMGISIAADVSPRVRRVIACAALLILAVGWCGIFDRKLYAAPHWVEPWEPISEQAAQVVKSGGITIGNNLSFFFYLTELLPPDDPTRAGRFGGLLPDIVRRRNVYTPEQWIASGASGNYPYAHTILVAEGLHFGTSQASTDEVERRLSGHCSLMQDRRFVRDIGSEWKQRFVPKDNQPPWRVEVKLFTCP